MKLGAQVIYFMLVPDYSVYMTQLAAYNPVFIINRFLLLLRHVIVDI